MRFSAIFFQRFFGHERISDLKTVFTTLQRAGICGERRRPKKDAPAADQ